LKKKIKVYGIRALNQNRAIPFYEELSKRSGVVSIHFNSFNLIVDMFLAICYREANPDKLENFKEEVKKEGKMTEELNQIFDTLAQPNPEKKVEKDKKLPSNESWYDLSKDTVSTPQFMLDPNSGKWVKYSSTNTNTSGTKTVPKSKKKKSKK